MIKIFVLHYSKLTERKKHILEQFEKYNIINFEFIEKYDKDEITENDSIIFNSTYKKSTMSLHLKHNYVYKQIAENYDNALIFEDDVILSDNFLNKLNNYMYQLPKDWDMLFIGDGCGLHIEKHIIKPDINVYKKCLYPTQWGGNGASKCSDSFVINKKCAIKLCEYIANLKYKIDLPIDWWLNDVSRYYNFNVYWAEPTIVTQGTETGLFKTSH